MGKVFERRRFWNTMSVENRKCVRRAASFVRAGTLTKVKDESLRLAEMREENRIFQEKRLGALKQVWLQKEAVEDLIEKLKYTNNDGKFNALCEELGVKPPSSLNAQGGEGAGDGENNEGRSMRPQT